MTRPQAPCHHCTVRTIHCHGVCDEYKEFKAKNDEYNAMLRAGRERYNDVSLENTVMRIEKRRKK